MKIRSFKGPSLERIYEAIHEEMGADAVIINTARSSGLKGLIPAFLRGGTHEVIAVTDDTAGDRHAVARILNSDGVRQFSEMNAGKLETLEKEFVALRTEIQGMSRGLATDPNAAAPCLCQPNDSPAPCRLPAFAECWDPRFVQSIMVQHPDFAALQDRARARELLAPFIPTVETFPVKQKEGPHVIVLTGPTGSGKTTTLAKLAARWSLGAHMKVGVITTDTYRVAAVDQIREYAVLLGLELKIAFSAAEASRAIRAFADKDVILVDTVGRSQHDASGLKALHGILNGLGRVTTLLLLPATWARTEVPVLIRNFKTAGTMYLVITKLDETRHHEVLTYAAAEVAMPIAFLTNGQRVPQDLHEARSDEMAALLVPNRETEK